MNIYYTTQFKRDYKRLKKHEKVLNEKEREIKEVYNRVFSDDSIKKEQLETSL